jgi:hypothetical protein
MGMGMGVSVGVGDVYEGYVIALAGRLLFVYLTAQVGGEERR